MPIPVQEIVERVTDLLLDKDRGDDEARWTDAELIRWINDSRMAVVTRRPAAGAKVSVATLVAGAYQAIPDDGTQLFDLISNMAADGITPGRAIRRTDRQNIDDVDPDWHAMTPSGTVSQFTFDDRVPKVFFVYPPAVAGTKVRMSYCAVPPAVAALGDTLDFDLQYLEPIINYVCYRAKAKDSQYANAAEAAAYYGAFNDALGANSQTQNAASPNQPGNSV